MSVRRTSRRGAPIGFAAFFLLSLAGQTGPPGVQTPMLTAVTPEASATSAGSFEVLGERPNVVLIVTDDQRFDELNLMPTLQPELQARGVTFTNGFVSNPLCCPSRASILTGNFSHTTGVYRNVGKNGGWNAFKKHEGSTIATWLHDAGYRTSLIGKYLNGYEGAEATRIPPGWDDWHALILGGKGSEGRGGYYGYTLDNQGTLETYGNGEASYSTDVMASKAKLFIQTTPSDQPLFLYFAPRAPHEPATPPRRYRNAFTDLPPYHPPNLNESDFHDKPQWAQLLMPLLDESALESLDRFRLKQLRSLMAVDDAVRTILDELSDTGRLQNTMIIYTSDNGMSNGEHRWPDKTVAWEAALRVPMIFRYDPVTSSVAGDGRDDLVLNVDIAPTIAEAGGVTPTGGTEGRSWLQLLQGAPWRSDLMLEHLFEAVPPIPSYCGVRTAQFKYVEYSDGSEELYDMLLDPYELESRAADPAYRALKLALHRRMVQLCTPPPPGFTP
jgi:arylsulfatase A-like enzyme